MWQNQPKIQLPSDESDYLPSWVSGPYLRLSRIFLFLLLFFLLRTQTGRTGTGSWPSLYLVITLSPVCNSIYMDCVCYGLL